MRNKRINLGKNLASAELSSQVVFADNPEMFVVAGYLKDKLEGTLCGRCIRNCKGELKPLNEKLVNKNAWCI